MDPIQSWVDPEEVRRLAESLISPPVRRGAEREEAGYGSQWVGFTGPEGPPPAAPGDEGPPPAPEPAPVQTQARQSLAAARRIAEQSGLLAGPTLDKRSPARAPAADPSPAQAPPSRPPGPPAVPPSPEEPATSPFVMRLQRFGAWLRQQVGARAFFVTTREGEVLVDEVRSPQLLQVARTLAHASRTANRQAGAAAVGSLQVKLAPEGVLEVIPIACRYGPLVLGIVVAEPMAASRVELVAGGLQQAVDGSAENP